MTFINKWDRPGRDPLELIDEIEHQLVLDPVPITWPVGDSDRFAGVIDRRTGDFVRYTRTARGSMIAPESTTRTSDANLGGPIWQESLEVVELLDAMGAAFDAKRFEAGELSPVFFGSALTNFGVRLLLDAMVELVPSPGPRFDAAGHPRSLDSSFSGIVFKVQANMNPAHRDRLAFLRVCSGHFSRGMALVNGRSGRTFATKYAHTVLGRDRKTATEAWPGDIIGLVNAGDLRAGDAVYADEPVRWPPVPSFAPSCFRMAFCRDTAKAKQFRSGVRQLDSEGVVQVLRRPEDGEARPILAAVGPLQFDVAAHRLRHEFGAPVEMRVAPWVTARHTDSASARVLEDMGGVTIAQRPDGERLALFESPYWLARLHHDHPELVLERLIGEG